MTQEAPHKYCSQACYHKAQVGRNLSAESRAKIAMGRETFFKTEEGQRQRKVMSRRMQENNPSKDGNVVQKILQTRRERGSLDSLRYHRGGNGKLSPMQMLLLNKLRDLVVPELAISLGRPRQPGYPTSYKVDLAIPQVRLAIEIDGLGHNTQTARSKDAKKQAKLESLGWRVLRYSNQAILENTDGIASEIRNLHKAMLSSMT